MPASQAFAAFLSVAGETCRQPLCPTVNKVQGAMHISAALSMWLMIALVMVSKHSTIGTGLHTTLVFALPNSAQQRLAFVLRMLCCAQRRLAVE